MCEHDRKYSWLICNWKIARRELDVSGSQHNPSIREKRLVRFVLGVLLGKPTLVQALRRQVPRLRDGRLAARAGAEDGRGDRRRRARRRADGARGAPLRRHASGAARRSSTTTSCAASRQLRNWRGDRLRTAKFQPITDPKAGPLIAIRLQPMARKSLGGIQTDLGARVLRADGEPIAGLYAVGRGRRLRRRRAARQALARGHLPGRLRLHRPDRGADDRRGRVRGRGAGPPRLRWRGGVVSERRIGRRGHAYGITARG